MFKKLKNKSELIYSYLNQFIVFISGIFFLIFIPKYYGVDLFGKFSLILSYITLFGILFGVSIHEGMKKEIIENKLDKKNIISLTFLSNSIYLKIIFNIFFFFILYIISFLFKLETINSIFIYFYILIFIMNIWGVFVNYFLSIHENKKYLYMSFFEYIIKIVSLIIFFVFGYVDIKFILLSFIFGYLGALIIGIIFFIKDNIILTKFDTKTLKVLLVRYIWLSISSISFLLITSIDNIIISYFFSNTELGYYNIAVNIINKSTIFTTALVAVSLPYFHLNESKGIIREKFIQYFKYLFLINIFISFGFFIFSSYIINIIYGKGYQSVIDIIQIIFFFPLFAILQSFFSGILVNFGEFKINMYVSLFVSLLNIVLNIVFINYIGFIGVSLATIISYFLWSLILGIFVYKRIIHY